MSNPTALATESNGPPVKGIRLADWHAGDTAYYNPHQPPFKHWDVKQRGERKPACFDFAFPTSNGSVMANPMPNHLPDGWKLLPALASVRFGDRILYGLNGATLHSAVVWKVRNGTATQVQQIIGPGLPVVCSNPNDPMILHGLKPLGAVRPPKPLMSNCLFPENAVIAKSRNAAVYTEDELPKWKQEHH